MLKNEPISLKIYYEFLPPNFSISPVLIAFLKRCNPNTGELILNPKIRKDVAAEADISLGRTNQLLSDFSKQNVLIWLDTGTYLANPFMFGFGSWPENKKRCEDLTPRLATESTAEYKTKPVADSAPTEDSTIKKLKELGLLK